MTSSLRARLFAALYDRCLAAAERRGLAALRASLLASAHGDALEIGAGTGLNLEHWPRSLASLTLAEPEEAMARRLERAVAERRPSARVWRCAAEDLAFADASFDVVASTLVLCTVPDQSAALAEIRRVLRRDGRLLFLEHVRSDEPRLARWQDRLNPLQRWLALGCEGNRRTAEAMRRAGFSLQRCERGELPAAYPIIRPMIHGVAVPA